MDFTTKHLQWDKYVRTFPYRGKRKYFPCIYQDNDGTIMIHNDVFGLTIAQFEREFKGCMTRRRENESEIQNIRFPDKTSKEYIEYLKRGDDTVNSFIRVRDLISVDPNFRCLVKMAGTEHDIRIRERMFILLDKIGKKHMSSSFPMIQISSGSLAEGIDLPGSDIDLMFLITNITVIDNIEHIHHSTRNTTLLTENDIHHPGFCKLKLVTEIVNGNKFVTEPLVDTENGLYLSTERFLQMLLTGLCIKDFSTHGPCLSNSDQSNDFAFCLKSKSWPNNAINWIDRHRTSQWPSCTLIDSILKDGCLLVPIAPRNSGNKLLWRISFSMAERRLVHSMNYTQILCYILLKLTLKNILNRNEEVKDLLCSYFLKTTIFWLSEQSINSFTICNLSQCYFSCIDKLLSFVRNCYCPNYFIPQHNMFIGKIDNCNSKPLIRILEELRNTEFPVILNCIFGNRVVHEFIPCDASMNLELLFCRVLPYLPIGNVESQCTTLQYIESLLKSESSRFILGVLRHCHAIINQQTPQLLVLPDRRHERYTTIRLCHKYLMEGTETDAVSGWLLYASFSYVLGDFKKTLQIVDNVLARCTPDMIWLDKSVYTKDDENKYQNKTENHLTLNQKMRHATLSHVWYIKQSILIPQELQVDVQDRLLQVPPVVMCQCLQFLCYHHLGDINNKQRTLRELYLTIQEGYFIHANHLSISLIILGVCQELSGDKHTAYQCYNEALHCEHYVCPSAEGRLANLFWA